MRDLDQAFTQFAATHGNRAVRLALVTLRDRQEAEDVGQEALVRLWRHAERHGMDSLSASLLYQTVVNLCRDHVRRRHRHPEDSTDPMDLPAVALDHPDRDQALAIMAAVEGLEPMERQVILLFYYLDQSLRQTAEIMGISEQLVKTRLFRARQHLKPLLAPIVQEEVT